MYHSLAILFFLLAFAGGWLTVHLFGSYQKSACRLRRESQKALVLLTEIRLQMLWMMICIAFLIVSFSLGLITVLMNYGLLSLS